MFRHYFLNAARSLLFCALVLSLWVSTAHAAYLTTTTNHGSHKVSMTDTSTNTLVASVGLGNHPIDFGAHYLAPPAPWCSGGPTATGSGNASTCFSGGGEACRYSKAQFIAAPPGAPPIPPTTPGPGIVFPHGLFDFTTTSCTAGSTLSFTITYPAALPPGTQYWKYGPTLTDAAPHWYVLPATIAGNRVTFTITDGGLGDDDLLPNGTIVDQGGPGSGGSTSVPTLSEWAIVMLVVVLLLATARRYRGTER